jgi:hypothetical protein
MKAKPPNPENASPLDAASILDIVTTPSKVASSKTTVVFSAGIGQHIGSKSAKLSVHSSDPDSYSAAREIMPEHVKVTPSTSTTSLKLALLGQTMQGFSTLGGQHKGLKSATLEVHSSDPNSYRATKETMSEHVKVWKVTPSTSTLPSKVAPSGQTKQGFSAIRGQHIGSNSAKLLAHSSAPESIIVAYSIASGHVIVFPKNSNGAASTVAPLGQTMQGFSTLGGQHIGSK